MTVKKKSKPKAKSKVKKPKTKLSVTQQLVAACKVWDRATDKAFAGDYFMPPEMRRFRVIGETKIPLYSSGDFKNLQCRISGNTAELNVGGSESHKAKVDMGKKTFDYFDWYSQRVDIMQDIFKSVGLKCTRSGDNLRCKGLTPKKLIPAFRTLVIPASMDFRLNYCRMEHTKEQCAYAEKEFFENGPKKEK